MEMMIKYFLSVTLCCVFGLPNLVHAQDQSGFISIDCGTTKSYKDEITGINYLPDAGFVSSGVNGKISSEINATLLDKQYWTLRSFPEGKKNCYTLQPTQGKNHTYFIRAGFFYGNYDSKSDVSRFDLYLGPNWWDTVSLADANSGLYYEIIHVPQSDNIEICLVNTGFGTPFISLLELRLLNSTTYVTKSGSLVPYMQKNCGSTSEQTVRFPNDIYDRIWTSFSNKQWENISASSTVTSIAQNAYRVPVNVLKTAVTQLNDTELRIGFNFYRDNPNSKYYLYLHFAEIEELQPDQLRAFDIYISNDLWFEYFVPRYLRSNTIYSINPTNETTINVRLYKAENSTLPPLLNAFEVYVVKELPEAETHKQDVDAIMSIKSFYNVDKHWQGDPCQPEFAIWDGLNCSYDGTNPPRIISLNLSSSGLTGSIAPAIADLKMLQYLDLSNNSLNGSIPEFLSELPFLKAINLKGNYLSGSIPLELDEKSKNKSLTLSVSGNKDMCTSTLCKEKFIVPLVSIVGAALGIILLSMAITWVSKSRKTGVILANEGLSNSKERKFAFSEVLSITNNLERIICRGNLGTVYHGYLDETPVAVKLYSASTIHECKQFRAEAKLITRVHHRHLTASLGYFDEVDNKGLIYEFMSNGSLDDIFSGKNGNLLSWQERLNIAMDAAQGLDYLHNACVPPIIHGNLKPSNILLNENYQAKLVDFGLSKISTNQEGSTEFLDPEYHVTYKLTERSDIYSFGVVLLTIVTNRSVIKHDRIHISQWVSSLMSKGDIKGVVDPRLSDDYHVDSAWKAVELAIACVSPISTKRPAIKQVVMELNQCLAMEMTRISRASATVEMVTVNLSTSLAPQAR